MANLHCAPAPFKTCKAKSLFIILNRLRSWISHDSEALTWKWTERNDRIMRCRRVYYFESLSINNRQLLVLSFSHSWLKNMAAFWNCSCFQFLREFYRLLDFCKCKNKWQYWQNGGDRRIGFHNNLGDKLNPFKLILNWAVRSNDWPWISNWVEKFPQSNEVVTSWTNFYSTIKRANELINTSYHKNKTRCSLLTSKSWKLFSQCGASTCQLITCVMCRVSHLRDNIIVNIFNIIGKVGKCVHFSEFLSNIANKGLNELESIPVSDCTISTPQVDCWTYLLTFL